MIRSEGEQCWAGSKRSRPDVAELDTLRDFGDALCHSLHLWCIKEENLRTRESMHTLQRHGGRMHQQSRGDKRAHNHMYLHVRGRPCPRSTTDAGADLGHVEVIHREHLRHDDVLPHFLPSPSPSLGVRGAHELSVAVLYFRLQFW